MNQTHLQDLTKKVLASWLRWLLNLEETRPDIKLGICGEHGGDPSSVEFCHKVG